MQFPIIFALAVILDLAAGEINFFPHPVKIIGKLINFLQEKLFDLHSFICGLAVCVITIFAAGLAVCLVLYFSGCNCVIQIYLLYAALSWRDLKDETRPVLFCLMNNDLEGARKFLSRVVGRDTKNLSEVEIIRALIETISENSIDGIFSVMFFAVLGYCVNDSYGAYIFVWIFKAASTLDSMIGYKTFHEFGKAGAKLDDTLNFFPARVGGLIIIIAGGLKIRALKIFIRDRLKHSSPNSAHGESSFAGVLDVKLGGGAFYQDKFISRPFINESARDPEIFDVIRAWNLLDASSALFAFIVIFLACIIFC
ncbi:MAG: cobalamin biosynthesis protein CobD [Synergistaceae bacterium]|nr:cobalamin biosynthesis protein CobD [Synergistaceae bacterium]